MKSATLGVVAAAVPLRTAVICLAVSLAACGGGSRTVELSAETSTTIQTSSTAAATATTVRSSTARGGPSSTGAEAPPAIEDDPFQRRDVPPEGVPGQLTFSLPRIESNCPVDGPAPVVTAGSGTTAIGDGVFICVSGFRPTPEVAVEVSLPGGATRRQSLTNAPERNDWFFTLGVTDPTGSYRVTAIQGQLRATAGFTAVLPDRPLMAALDPTTATRGAVFRFALVSPAPRQTLTMDLYRRQGTTTFVTTLGTVGTDARARATYQVATRRDSPAGEYCLVVRPYDVLRGCASFTVR